MATLKGTWRFNDELTVGTAPSQQINFSTILVSDTVVLTTIEFLYGGDGVYELYYKNENESHLVCYIDTGEYSWSISTDWNKKYQESARTITFTSEQGVSNEFYKWFTANAKPVIKAGTYRFKDVLTIPNADMSQDIEFTSQWSVPQEYWDGYMQEVGDIDLGGINNPVIIKCNKMLVGLGDDGYHDLSYNVTESNSFFSIDGEELLFPSYGERYLYVCYSNESGYWKYGFLTITVTEDATVSEEFYEWFTANTKPVIKAGTYRFNNDASPIIHLFDKSNQTEIDEVFNLYSFPIEPVSYSVGEEDFIVRVSYITPLIAYKYVSPTFGYEVTQIQKAAVDGYGEFIGTSDNDITEFTIPVDTEVTTEVATWFAENAAEQKYLSGLWTSHPGMSVIPYETIPWNYGMGEEEALYSKYGIDIEPMLVEGEYWAYGFTPILTRCMFDTDGTLLGSEIGGIGKFKNVGEEDYHYFMTVTYAPDYDTANIIPGNYNALSVDWVKSNLTELKALSGTWWIDTDSPAIPYEVIPYHWGREEEEALYNKYGIDIEPIYFPPNNNTIYGGTPFLTMAHVGEDGEILGYYKRIINKVKEEGEDFYRYKSYTSIDSDYNKITVIPGYYNAMIVDWFYQHATNVRFARLYHGEVVYSSGGRCFKRLTTDEQPQEESIVGTWVFNDALDFSGVTKNIDYNAWGNIYGVRASMNILDTTKQLVAYMDIRSNGWAGYTYPVYKDGEHIGGGNLWFYGEGEWKQSFTTAEKTLIIPPPDDYTGDYKNVDGYNEFLTWLKTNATKQPTILPAGLYDANDNLVASWDTLVNTYGMDCEKDYTVPTHKSDTASPHNVFQTSDLSSGRKLIIANSVTSIGNRAFEDCSGLTSITIPDSVTSIGSYAFYYCSSLTSIIIPDSVTSIGNDAFVFCSSLTSIIIPDGVTSIGYNAFVFCSSLTSIIIPDSVTSIDDYAFSDCTGLTEIVIPDSVTIIGEGAFFKCHKLTNVYYTGTEEQWAEISILLINTELTNATIHYNYSG